MILEKYWEFNFLDLMSSTKKIQKVLGIPLYVDGGRNVLPDMGVMNLIVGMLRKDYEAQELCRTVGIPVENYKKISKILKSLEK